MAWLQYLLTILIIASLIGSIVFSVRTRTQKDPHARGLLAARTNMAMGVMLMAMALLQSIAFTMSSLRLIIAVLFALLGLFNLFAGVRSHGHYMRKKGN